MGIEKTLAVGNPVVLGEHVPPDAKTDVVRANHPDTMALTLLTAQQAAAVLTVSLRTLDRMVHKGIVRQHRVGLNGPRRFLMQDIERVLIPDQSPNQPTDALSSFISNTIRKEG